MTRKGVYAALPKEEKDRLNSLRRERYKTPEGRRASLSSGNKRRYGISIDEKEALLLNQGGVCAICSQVDTTAHGWHVDHDHSTGKVRGILCHHCNVMLGQAQDNIDRLLEAVHYLMKHGKVFSSG